MVMELKEDTLKRWKEDEISSSVRLDPIEAVHALR